MGSSRTRQVKDYGIGICYISAKHAALLNQALMCQSGGACLPADCVIFHWGRIYKLVKYNRITMSQNNIKKILLFYERQHGQIVQTKLYFLVQQGHKLAELVHVWCMTKPDICTTCNVLECVFNEGKGRTSLL